MAQDIRRRLDKDVEAVNGLLSFSDGLRGMMFPVETTGGPTPSGAQKSLAEGLASIFPPSISRLDWHVYDHCAALTRLYAIYEQFVEDLVVEYLSSLPNLYTDYADLSEKIRVQHRLGVGQILQKLGTGGPFKDLAENKVIKGISEGLLKGGGYSLLKEAFLLDPQNYRQDVIMKLFGYLGFENCWSWVEKHPAVASFMELERDSTETAGTILHEFIEYRNLASHTNVDNLLAIDQIKSFGKFITVLCEALSQMVLKSVIRRKVELGKAQLVGNATHSFFGGTVTGVRTSACEVSVGQVLVVVQKHACFSSQVISIEHEHQRLESVQAVDGQQIGIRLTNPAKIGAEIFHTNDEPSTLPIEPTNHVGDKTAAG